MKSYRTRLRTLLGLFLIVSILGLCVNHKIQNAKSRDAGEQYSQDSGCGWSGNDATGNVLWKITEAVIA